MTDTINEDAIRKIASMEEGVSVTAGSLDTDAFYRQVERQKAMSQQIPTGFSTVLGRFLNLARRERSLSLEQLSEEIDASAMDLFLIEEGRKIPEPQIISKLARSLNLPPGRLMQLAGHVQTLDKEVVSAANAFAGRTNSKPLEAEEREALHEFVKALTSP